MPAHLTHLLTEEDVTTLQAAILAKAQAAIGTPACETWHEAFDLLLEHRSASFKRRADDAFEASQKPTASRPSLGLRYTR